MRRLRDGLVHLPQAEDREPVGQSGEAEGEVIDRDRGARTFLPHSAGDDRGELVAPRAQQFLKELAHLPVVRRARPDPSL